MRMDRYNNLDNNEDETYSRTLRNQDMYQDIYMNNSIVDIDDYFNKKEEEQEDNQEELTYEAKNYSVKDYLEKAHERQIPDAEKRKLDDTFKEEEDEISKLIASIDEKNEQEDFFSDLKGDNEDTIIEGQVTKKEVEELSYEEYSFDTNTGNVVLDKVVGNETISNLSLEEDKTNDEFDDILKNKTISNKKKRRIALIFFLVTLLLLIGVVVYILFLK